MLHGDAMNLLDDRVFYLIAGVVLGWLLHWLWSRAPQKRPAPKPAVEPGSIIAPPTTKADSIPETPTREPVSSRLIDVSSARAAGFNIKHAEDLTIIDGIGPKTDDLLRANGIGSFAQLARLQVADLLDILEAGGASFRLANPQTWAEQASLAAENRWSDLKRLQQDLVDGAISDSAP